MRTLRLVAEEIVQMISKLDGRNLYTATLSSFEVVAAALKNETDRSGAPAQLFIDRGHNIAYLKFPDTYGAYRIVKVKIEGELVQKNNGWTSEGASVKLMFG